ncbi:MAG: Acyl-coenzyme A:6-aminopenicillanic acid acyl-transferase [Methanosaeta sp. PtaU1.Bin112]|nr:MAG: Acyl-coenzyme A:6-aminopenicillanic acid acyl-transferase [Methanosaeta sp. PtaU1.Bin112]
MLFMSRRFAVLLALIPALFYIALAAEVPHINPHVNDPTTGYQQSPAILKDEIIIAKDNGSRVEWRHIILQGNNTEIGMALGQIAQKDYGVESLSKYAGPIYGKARREYMEKNYPPMFERMAGIAKAYGLPADNYTFDTTTLAYDAGSMACSMIYFPPETMISGHATASRNTEWYLVPMDYYINMTDNMTGNAAASRDFLMEIYPDQGYSTMVLSMIDLNSATDGLNSEGLGISMLEDSYMGGDKMAPLAGARDSGINNLQLARLILETCKTVEEAKIAFLNNREFFSADASHYMVYDSSGNSTVVEWNRTSESVIFTDGIKGKPNIMTNHPIYLYTNYALEDLPREMDLIPYGDPYDSFIRYITLSNITNSQKGKFTDMQAADALSAVSPNTVIAAEGAMRPLPINTIYHVLMDLDNRSMMVKFYLNNGPVDPETKKNTSIFSPYMTFKMNG